MPDGKRFVPRPTTEKQQVANLTKLVALRASTERQIGNDRDRLNTPATKLFRAQSCWQDLLVRVVLLLVDTRFQVGILRVRQERSAA
jgi:hypothetical protein